MYKKVKKKIEDKLFLNTIYNIDFLINVITLLIKNASVNNINIILDNYILSEIKKNMNDEINSAPILNYYLKMIKRIVKIFFKNLSPTLLNNNSSYDGNIKIENKFECALHMFFTVNLGKDSSDNVISKYYDYYYSIDSNKCKLNFGIYENLKMNDVKKKIIYDGICLFIKKCIQLKIEFNNEDIRHIKSWTIKPFDKSKDYDLNNSKLIECPICLEHCNFDDCVNTKCKHNYCINCFKNMIKVLKPYHNPICPLCRSINEELYINEKSCKKDFIVI
jgi:hypothetical protein